MSPTPTTRPADDDQPAHPRFELEHVTVENERLPDECVVFPRNAGDDERRTAWMIATEESYVDLDSRR
ncbi:DUF7511 domain-containing protein [Natronobiforma cellulositropha]|uniref:DUF7511 domain-containing protein n=1 Tax=Natronobiforma cellulositropha TaxID=1679076 RepID=UPI0021D5C022|nr:hypothetical protein [Natronobiforma cellulositropha]